MVRKKHIQYLQEKIKYKRIEEQFEKEEIKKKIRNLQEKYEKEICSNITTAFWERKMYIITLPYEKDFDERNILTRARSTQMNEEMLEFYKKEIQDLLDKRIIRKSKSPWICTTFYVNNSSEQERGDPRLVINYKPLNDVLQ